MKNPKLDLRKAPSSPDRIISAPNSFSSLDVPSGTSPSDKTVFARADSPWKRGIVRKSSKDNIIKLPNVNLRTRSKRVGVINESVQAIIDEMIDATLNWEDSREHEVGVALAAIQIDVHLRIVVVRSDFDNKTDRTFQVFINPEITKFDGELLEDFEGCLSIKDVYGKVPRYARVKVKAINQHGKPVRITADGFLARVLQHEVDHTNGKMFVDHIKDSPNAFYKLQDDGHLTELDYEKDIRTNSILW